jgi:hypothetical protein
MLAKVPATRVMLVARATVLVWVVRKRTVGRWVLVVLALLRIPVAAVAAIGVVGLLVILRNLIAQALVVIQAAVVVPVTPRLMY